MQVHRCYAPLIHPLLDKFEITGMAHITGGGITGNLRRIIPDGLSAEIKKGTWPALPIFDFLRKEGGVEEAEMYNAFNMGLGYIIVVRKSDVDSVIGTLKANNETAYRVGQIVGGSEKVRLI
jgi:phosphoribosylformylglycinamidine cyclo-ligase